MGTYRRNNEQTKFNNITMCGGAALQVQLPFNYWCCKYIPQSPISSNSKMQYCLISKMLTLNFMKLQRTGRNRELRSWFLIHNKEKQQNIVYLIGNELHIHTISYQSASFSYDIFSPFNLRPNIRGNKNTVNMKFRSLSKIWHKSCKWG